MKKQIITLSLFSILLAFKSNAQTVTGSGTLNYLTKWTATGSTVGSSSLFDNGKIGIGTTAPGEKIEILNNTASIGAEGNFGLSILSALYDTKLVLGAKSGSYSVIQSLQNSTGWASRPLILQPNGGYVGIGTIAPSQQLEVTGTTKANTDGVPLIIQSSSTGSRPNYISWRNSAGTPRGYLGYEASDENFYIETAANANLYFATNGAVRATISGAGNVGINNSSPIAKLQVTNGSVLFDGTTGTTPVSGGGTRMMWIPAKAAFRAGTVAGTQWDDVNIGNYSFASGQNTTANGNYSAALGYGATASGMTSMAFGYNTTSSGFMSASFGYNTTAQSYNSLVIGQFNYNPGTYNGLSWVLTDPLFVIGNGTYSGATSNAFTVLKNGKVSIGVPDNKMVGNYNLYVKDGLLVGMCKIADINTADWSDFVFHEDYNLMPLNEVEKFVKKNKHLPDVPSATEVNKTGIDVAKMDAVLLQKIEELTLYNIQLQKQMDELNKKIEAIQTGK